MNSRLMLLGAVIFAVGILLLALLLNRVVKRIRYRGSSDPRRQPPPSPGVFSIVSALILVVLGQGLIWLSSQIGTYRPIGSDGLIGKLRVERLTDPVKSLEVTFTPVGGESGGVPNLFYLSGDSWKFQGEIINFKFANEYLGLPIRACKTTEFHSRFIERLPPKASGALLNRNKIEGGGSAAYRLFRDKRYFDWFAHVDSFAIDYVTTSRCDSFAVKLAPDGSLNLESSF
jgi:hypothetical protein